jgi:glycerol kinase
MEAIALQVGDLIGAMSADSGHAVTTMRVDGGVTVNTLIMATLADVLAMPVERAAVAESTALGAAFLAGSAVGVWSGPDDLPALRAVDRTFDPDPAQAARIDALRERWAEALRRSLRWEQA